MHSIFEQFVTLWVVIDPVGTIPVFVAVTASIEAQKRTGIAIQASVLAICVLLFFLVAGQFLIDALGIGLLSFQIAGGLILFVFAQTMIFGDAKPKREISEVETGEEPESPAVYPLAVPSLASPGAMLAVVLLTDNNRFSYAEQAVTAGLLIIVVGFALILMLLASPILKLIGTSGAAIVSRVMGMILASVAVDNIIQAVLELIRTNAA